MHPVRKVQELEKFTSPEAPSDPALKLQAGRQEQQHQHQQQQKQQQTAAEHGSYALK